MINLLPPETKATYRYARRNRTLLRWCGGCVVTLALGGLLAGGGCLYMNRFIADTSQQVDAANDQLAREHLPEVQKQVTSITDNLKLVVQVLSQEVLFSELLQRLAVVTPKNVVLTGLSITQTKGGLDISAKATDYQEATQFQANLADPANQIFSKADIETITCNAANGDAYPCTETLRALFVDNSPYLFINTTTGEGGAS